MLTMALGFSIGLVSAIFFLTYGSWARFSFMKKTARENERESNEQGEFPAIIEAEDDDFYPEILSDQDYKIN